MGPRIRRRGFVTGVLASLALSACWPAPNGHPDRTGHNPSESTLTTATVGGLAPRWDVAGGGEIIATVGAVFQNTLSSEGAPGVRRLDSATGDIEWSVPVTPIIVPYGYTSHLSYVDGEIVVPYTNPVPPRSPSGGVVTLDPVDGATTGTVSLSAGNHTVRGGRQLTTVRGSFLIGGTPSEVFTVWDRVNRTIVTNGYAEQTIDANDAFEYTLGETVVLISASGVDQPDGTVGGELRSMPIAGAGPAWTAPLPESTPTAAVINASAGLLHVGTAEGRVVTVDAATGAVLWSADAGGAVTQLPALADGNLYVSTGAGELVVFDADGCGAATCTPSWRATLAGAGPTQPAVGGSGASAVVYVAMAGGGLAAFPAAGCGAATCEPLWTGSVTGAIVHGPIVSGGQVLVSTDADRLVAFGLP